jgi:hypothetical protein
MEHEAAPGLYLVLTPDLTIVAASDLIGEMRQHVGSPGLPNPGSP